MKILLLEFSLYGGSLKVLESIGSRMGSPGSHPSVFILVELVNSTLDDDAKSIPRAKLSFGSWMSCEC